MDGNSLPGHARPSDVLAILHVVVFVESMITKRKRRRHAECSPQTGRSSVVTRLKIISMAIESTGTF